MGIRTTQALGGLLTGLFCLADATAQPPSASVSDLQYVGTHNSYHIEPDQAVFDLMKESGYEESRKWPARKLVRALAFTHPDIATQLDLGLRVFEFDLHDDPEGKRFSAPGVYEVLAAQGYSVANPLDPAGDLERGGLKVFHTADTDVRSHCLLLSNCLTAIRDWSVNHPGHVPIFIQLETKESRKPVVADGYTPAAPAPFTTDSWRRLHQEIFAIFGREHLILPKDVQRTYPSVNQAVRSAGWPSIETARGKIVFLLLDDAPKQTEYQTFVQETNERILFVTLDEHDPDTAWVMRNNPKSRDIERLVRSGLLVYTRADTHTNEARNFDVRRANRAVVSGAQLISTDFPIPDPRYSDYAVTLNGRYIGCNRIRNPEGCSAYMAAPK